MLIYFIISIPVIAACSAGFINNKRAAGTVNALAHTVNFLIVLTVIAKQPVLSFPRFFLIDELSLFFLLTITAITMASAWYSIGYIENDLDNKIITPKQSKIYYILFNLFSFSMLFAVVQDNLGLLWVSIEMTTLASAFLVGFYNNKKSVEAAWKYIIICSVGISLALLGTILLYYAVAELGLIKSLDWSEIMTVAKNLNPNIIKTMFIFILAGYGTKSGLALMHSWLPDAHSQAPAPISALLSGVLIKTSLYAILRFAIITDTAVGSGFTQHLFLIFGLASVGLAAGFILVQKDIKRLLAYSTIEHMGIILIGLGFGGFAGCYGALFHLFNHAAGKAFMFFSAGSIVKIYGTHKLARIRGIIKLLPFTGGLLILAVFALCGVPPFSIFFSELIILSAGFAGSAYISISLTLLFLALAFGGLVFHFSRAVFGKIPENIKSSSLTPIEKTVLTLLFIVLLVLGLYMPPGMHRLISGAAVLVSGCI